MPPSTLPKIEPSSRLTDSPVKVGARPSFGKRALHQSLWICGALLLSACLVEGIFRTVHVGEEELLKFEPVIAFSHFKHKLITFRSEGFSQDVINSAGFHDTEHAMAKPAGVTRIALLGDSKTEALQVPIQATFGKLLENKLNANAANGKHEVLNFGVSDYSTGQEYMLYLDQVAKYKPDVVVVAFHMLDADENCVPSAQDPNVTPRPYFAVKDNKLVVDWTPMQNWTTKSRAKIYKAVEPLRESCRSWGVISQLETSLYGNKTLGNFLKLPSKVFGRPIEQAIQKLPSWNWNYPSLTEVDPAYAQSAGTASITDLGSRKPNASAVDAFYYQAMLFNQRQRWPVTEHIFHQLNAACKSNGSKLVIVSLPAPNNSLFYFKEVQWLRGFAGREGIQFLDVQHQFPSYAPMETNDYLLPKMHFSRRGHELMAECLYAALNK